MRPRRDKELSGALLERNGLRPRVDRNVKAPKGRLDVAPGVVLIVRELNHLQAPTPRTHHADGEDHEGPEAHHVVGRHESSPRIYHD
jgi:hypothetical protein